MTHAVEASAAYKGGSQSAHYLLAKRAMDVRGRCGGAHLNCSKACPYTATWDKGGTGLTNPTAVLRKICGRDFAGLRGIRHCKGLFEWAAEASSERMTGERVAYSCVSRPSEEEPPSRILTPGLPSFQAAIEKGSELWTKSLLVQWLEHRNLTPKIGVRFL